MLVRICMGCPLQYLNIAKVNLINTHRASYSISYYCLHSIGSWKFCQITPDDVLQSQINFFTFLIEIDIINIRNHMQGLTVCYDTCISGHNITCWFLKISTNNTRGFDLSSITTFTCVCYDITEEHPNIMLCNSHIYTIRLGSLRNDCTVWGSSGTCWEWGTEARETAWYWGTMAGGQGVMLSA